MSLPTDLFTLALAPADLGMNAIVPVDGIVVVATGCPYRA